MEQVLAQPNNKYSEEIVKSEKIGYYTFFF